MSSDIKQRYFAKLVNNFLIAGLGLITVPYLARTLGPEGMGLFDFSTESLKTVLDLSSFGIPMALFTWMSTRRGERAKAGVLFGLFYCALLAAIVGISLVMLSKVKKLEIIWPGLDGHLIAFAFALQVLAMLHLILTNWADALGHTVFFEKLRSWQSLMKTLLILIFCWLEMMNLKYFFQINIAMGAIFGLIAIIYLWRTEGWRLTIDSTIRSDFMDLVKFLITFSTPLTIYTLFSQGADYFGSWMLQFYGGTVERGYFSLANKVSAVIFMFASALTPIFMREIAMSAASGRPEEIVKLFDGAKGIIFLTAIISVFSSVNAVAISGALGGDQFKSGSIALGLMCLYPAHQVLGQLCGAYFYATARMRQYAWFGIASSIISIPLIYFFEALPNAVIPGLGLGSMGRAIQLVVMQVFTTNVLLYMTCLNCRMSYRRWLSYQLKVVLVLTMVSLFSKFFASYILGLWESSRSSIEIVNIKLVLVANLLSYSALVLVAVKMMPSLIGLKSLETSLVVNSVGAYLRLAKKEK